MALEELKRLFPKVQDTALIRSLVIKEGHATLSPKVGTESLRPGWQSPIQNLWLAGDWTRTGLPGTIESACVSGHACAELVAAAPASSFPAVTGGESMMDPRQRRSGMTGVEVHHVRY